MRELPPSHTIRWVPRRKAEIVLAVCNGVISENEACARYRLTPEELAGWKLAYQRGGVRGLRLSKGLRGA